MRQPKLIDAFTYCGEVQTLRMRLSLHYDHVDQFWIVEGDHTFSGKFKGWTFDGIRNQLLPWQDKIRFIPFEAPVVNLDFSRKDREFNFSSPAWLIENLQRNALSACLEEMSDDDIVIVSDLDEFIDPEVLSRLRHEKIDVVRLSLMNHYYYMNCRAISGGKDWCMPLAVSAKWWRKNPDISTFRPCGAASWVVPHAGWHFSYLGGAEAITKKIASFSHTELDRPEINNIGHLAQCIETGKNFIGTEGHDFAFYPVASYPESIQNLMRKNRNFVRWTL